MRTHWKILRKNERGATAVYAAVVLTVLVMFAAFAVDVNYLFGVRNELHNAADAGSLAGASVLFNDDGSLNRQAAIDEGNRIASANKTGTENVYVKEVQTGHWSFANKTFTASENTTQVEWQERSFDELDADPDFINAVRVHTERGNTPAFFSKILGFDKFFVSIDAVAYIGFAGTLLPGDLDQPIAICKESITDPANPEEYSCNMGRMLNSGKNPATHNTGGWTNFSQPCQTASASDMNALVCADGNPDEVQFGEGLGSTGGVQDSTLADMYDCWVEKSDGKKRNWNMTLPVVECPGNNVSNCAKLVGAVNVNVVWIVHQNDPHFNEAPREMTVYDQDGNLVEQWSSDEPDGFDRWQLFVDAFDLTNVDGSLPPFATEEEYEELYQKKNIFFLPDCEEHEPTGRTGGENYGILAKYPVLVK